MPDKGGTYTIVVDENGEIVSGTYNGVMMIDRPDEVIGRHPKDHGNNMGIRLTLPDELSSCICLAQFINPVADQDDNIKWSKLV